MSLGVQSGGGGAFNLETGSYTGTNGSSKTFTFKGTPVFFCVRSSKSSYGADSLMVNVLGLSGKAGGYYANVLQNGTNVSSQSSFITVSGNSITITPYHSSNLQYRDIFNDSSYTYDWFAITV